MKCPYCKQEMVLGYIQSSRMLVWDKEKLSGIIIPNSLEDGMRLTKGIWKKCNRIKLLRKMQYIVICIKKIN